MRAPDETTLFDYNEAEWAEIEAAVQAARRGPLPKEAIELLRAAARDYLAETATSPARAARGLKKKWRKLATSSERLYWEFSACCEETACEIKRKGRLTQEEKFRLQLLHNIRLHLNWTPGIAKTMARHFNDQDDKPNSRVRYQSKVLEIWVGLGGKLQISRHPKTQEIRGPLARFFFAAARPVMGASTPAPDSLRDIVKRQKKSMGEVDMGTERPRRFNLMGLARALMRTDRGRERTSL